jgi:hypothetical protein
VARVFSEVAGRRMIFQRMEGPLVSATTRTTLRMVQRKARYRHGQPRRAALLPIPKNQLPALHTD